MSARLLGQILLSAGLLGSLGLWLLPNQGSKSPRPIRASTSLVPVRMGMAATLTLELADPRSPARKVSLQLLDYAGTPLAERTAVLSPTETATLTANLAEDGPVHVRFAAETACFPGDEPHPSLTVEVSAKTTGEADFNASCDGLCGLRHDKKIFRCGSILVRWLPRSPSRS